MCARHVILIVTDLESPVVFSVFLSPSSMSFSLSYLMQWVISNSHAQLAHQDPNHQNNEAVCVHN